MLVFRGIPVQAETSVALTIGNFDGVHLGHRALLARLRAKARELGLPSCLLTFEPHPREFFDPENAPARLTSLDEKLELLDNAGIDRVHVCPFDADFAAMPASDFISRFVERGLAAKYLLIGDDFRFGARRAGDFELMKTEGSRFGLTVESMASETLGGVRISSTGVRAALKSGDLELAKSLLGRPYSISGQVGHGDKLGGKIGYPTANIRLEHNKPPLTGIYAVRIRGLGKEPLPAVASLGVRPTVRADGKPVLEVHIFDFSADIYGRRLTVDFLLKLRDEMKFPDLDSLVRQIGLDAAEARSYFQENTRS